MRARYSDGDAPDCAAKARAKLAGVREAIGEEHVGVARRGGEPISAGVQKHRSQGAIHRLLQRRAAKHVVAPRAVIAHRQMRRRQEADVLAAKRTAGAGDEGFQRRLRDMEIPVVDRAQRRAGLAEHPVERALAPLLLHQGGHGAKGSGGDGGCGHSKSLRARWRKMSGARHPLAAVR